MNGKVTLNISNNRNPKTFEVGLSAPCITLCLMSSITEKNDAHSSKICIDFEVKV